MSKYFYSHLIEIDSLVIELNKMDLSDEEKNHLILLTESSLYHAILETILSELSDEDKKIFLKHLVNEDHDKIWQLLNKKVIDIENKIKKTANDLKIQLHEDIKETNK